MSVVHSKERRARLAAEQPVYPSDKDIEHGDCDHAYTERNRESPAQPCAGQAFDNRYSLGNAFEPLNEGVDRSGKSRHVDLSLSEIQVGPAISFQRLSGGSQEHGELDRKGLWIARRQAIIGFADRIPIPFVRVEIQHDVEFRGNRGISLAVATHRSYGSIDASFFRLGRSIFFWI